MRSKGNKEDNSANTPMFIACDNILNQNSCETDILNSLIQAGGNVNDTINVNFVGANYLASIRPLMEASKGNYLDIVKALIENK